MNGRRILLALSLVALVAPGVGLAQGLGDTAAREREKRAREKQEKKDEPPAPVFTNDDLDAVRPPGEERDSTEAASSSPAPSTSRPSRVRRPSPASGGTQDEAVRQAQARVDALEAQIREAGSQLNPMSTDYIYGPSGSNDANEEIRIRQELSELQQQLNQARQELARAKEGLASPRRSGGGGPDEGTERNRPQ